MRRSLQKKTIQLSLILRINDAINSSRELCYDTLVQWYNEQSSETIVAIHRLMLE